MNLTVVKVWLGQWLVFGQGEPLIRRLDPATRVKVLAALAGLIILGFGMVMLTWLGGRAVRRYMRSPPFETSWRSLPRRSLPRRSEDDWAEQPLSPESEESE